MEDLSLHILDIAENSLKAGAKNIEIVIRENLSKDLLTIEINDDGSGMSPEVIRKASDPFYTTRTTRRVGLGLALFDEAARMAGGEMDIKSQTGSGTKICASFRLGHIDRKPVGNMAETITALVAAGPEVDITYRHERNGDCFTFSTKELKSRLDGLPTNSAGVLTFIRKYLSEEENNLLH